MEAPVPGGEARPARRPAVHQGVEQQRPRQGGGRLQLGDVEMLSLTGLALVEEAGQDGHGPEIAADMVEIGEGPAGRGPVGESDHEGEPGEGLGRRSHRHVGDVGPGVPEAAHRDVDDLGLDLLQDVVAEPPAVEGSGGEGFGDDIGDSHQVFQEGQTLSGAGRRR